MALTKEDLQAIKGVVGEVVQDKVPGMIQVAVTESEQRLWGKVEKGLDDLALAAQQQFLAIDGRFDALEVRMDRVENRMDGLESRFDVLEGRFDVLEGRVSVIAQDTGAIKRMVKDHSYRISKLEHQANH